MASRPDADVIVVGAGPAGATVALLLARAGLDVLVLERRAHPRAKPCGDCLSPQAGPLLDRFGLLDDVLRLRPARLAGWRIIARSGEAFEERFAAIDRGGNTTDHALAVERIRLDAAIAAAAATAGARLRYRAHVTGRTTGNGLVVRCGGEVRRFRAPLVIGADGLRSVMTRTLAGPARPPRLRKFSLTAHMKGVLGDDGLGEMHLGRRCCIGIAPVREDGSVHNVTLVVDHAEGRALARDPVAFFRAALERFPVAKARLAMADFTDEPRAGTLLASGPFDFPVRTIIADGIALAGDAAGYYDPFTGQGIYQAIATAELLANVAIHAVRDGDVSAARLRAYARARARLLRGTRLVQRGIEAVISRPALADRVVGRLRQRPAAARALLAVTGDLAPPVTLLSPGLLLGFLAPRLAEEGT